MKKRLLIINKAPWGRVVDTYKWCQYLKDSYKITFISFDNPDINGKAGFEDVDHIMVPLSLGRTLRGITFMIVSFWHILLFRSPIIVVWFKESIWFKRLTPRKKMILDVRTLSISRDAARRKRDDALLRHAATRYDHITIISEGVRKKINIQHSRTSILPLGADQISSRVKDLSGELKLLYVGTLSGRDIDKSIVGLKSFIDNNPSAKITYDIVGSGNTPKELEELKVLCEGLGLNDVVTLHGRVANSELKPFFDRCNVGISFVPLLDHYDQQPVTKSYEYIMSGLYCIATSTFCNREIITPINGTLIKDSSRAFCEALDRLYNNPQKATIESEKIMKSLAEHNWKSIIDGNLAPIIEQIQ